jgi:hypothetical protein
MIEIIEKLEKFLIKNNGNEFGFGFDRYKPTEKFHYAEAYAQWGMGFVDNFRLTNDTDYLLKAEYCTTWLLNNTKSNYKYPCWGLPWKWENWEVPAEIGYLITTVFVGEFFLNLYEVKRNQSYLNIAKLISRWIFEENGGKLYRDGYYFYYANSPKLRYFIPNPSAKAVGFISHLYSFTNEYESIGIINQAIKSIIDCQLERGGWHYSEYSAQQDITHNGFILDGLFNVLNFHPNQTIKQSFNDGILFFKDVLHKGNGGFLNRTFYKWEDLQKISLFILFWDNIKKNLPILNNNIAPLWGYASAIRTFTHASWLEEKYIIYPEEIISWIETNLQNKDGSFAYSIKEKNVYIRHLAHLYQAISYYNYRKSNLLKTQ